MEQARSNVRRMLMEAREQRDVVKTLCLNDKLTQLNVAISSAQERRDALAAAVKRGELGLFDAPCRLSVGEPGGLQKKLETMLCDVDRPLLLVRLRRRQTDFQGRQPIGATNGGRLPAQEAINKVL